MIKIELGKG